MNEFYVTLPSNVKGLFKQNTQSDFTTLLDTPILLLGEYKVALVEIDYSNNLACLMGTIDLCHYGKHVFINPLVESTPLELIIKNGISKSDFVVELDKKLKEHCIKYINDNIRYVLENKIPEFYLTNDCFLKDSFKQDLNDVYVIDLFINNDIGFIIDSEDSELKSFYKQCNGNFKKDLNKWKFSVTDLKENELHNISFNRWIVDGDFNSYLSETKQINQTFVIKKPDLINNLEIRWSGAISYSFFKLDDYVSNLDESIPLITEFDFLKYACIYCNIIEDQYFGNKLTPILKMITIDKSSNSLVKNLENLHYVNVKKSWIDNINITIKDMSGNQIYFVDEFSFVVVKLHFKKH